MILLVSLLFVYQAKGGEWKGQHAFPVGHFRLADGLLVIELVREVPEAMKPKKISIGGNSLKVVENKDKDDDQASAA